MLPLDKVPVARLVVFSGVCVAIVAIWAAACMWMERDARLVHLSRRWLMPLVWVGGLLLVGTLLIGTAAVAFMAIPLLTLILLHTVSREASAPPEERLFRLDVLHAAFLPVARLMGLQPSWARLRPVPSTVGEPAVVLLKKDGTVYGGVSRGVDRQIAEAVQATQRIVGKAITLRATDIHFEPHSAEEYKVRFRIDGIMQTRQVLTAEAGRAVVSTLKVLGDMDIAERRRPQDGTFAICIAERRFDVRAASGPTNFGEKISLRILDGDGDIVKSGLARLGMRDSLRRSLQELIKRPHGMLVVTGPTGSGKTTTLYACLHEIDTLTRNVVTIEDPIEYRLANISQTAVNVAAGLTFAKILRSVLRQDPDVILVGEIRDHETAEIAMQAALTGHFVLTTLHANDTATTFTRLKDIGVDESLIQSAVSAVLAQRLVRLLCPKCKQAYEPPAELLHRLRIPAERATTFFKERGCDACQGTGYYGRTGVYELMVDGTKTGTLWQSALYKVVKGQTSLAEAERVVR